MLPASVLELAVHAVRSEDPSLADSVVSAGQRLGMKYHEIYAEVHAVTGVSLAAWDALLDSEEG